MPVKDGLIILEKQFAFKNIKIIGARSQLKLKLQYLAIWCEELTHWKRPWCWERLMAGGEGDDRGWDGWMASPTQWTWVWVSSGSWWWTGKPGMLQSMGSQSGMQLRNWTELIYAHMDMHCRQILYQLSYEGSLYIYILKESALMTLDFSMKLILDFCSPEL